MAEVHLRSRISCKGLSNERLANALIDNGAETVLGFTSEVGFFYADEMLLETFINGMILSGDTAGYSADEARRVYGERDFYSGYARLRFVGYPDYRFVNSIHSNGDNNELPQKVNEIRCRNSVNDTRIAYSHDLMVEQFTPYNYYSPVYSFSTFPSKDFLLADVITSWYPEKNI